MTKDNLGAMRNSIKAFMALAAVMAFSSIAFSQNPNDPNWELLSKVVFRRLIQAAV